MYAQNLVDYHLVIDMVPEIARLYFTNKLGEEFNMSLVQSAILLGVGLQKKTVEELEKDLQLPPNQLLAMFNKVIKKFITLLEEIQVNQIDRMLFKPDSDIVSEKMQPLKQNLEAELKEAADKIKEKEQEHKRQLLDEDLKQYEIKGTDKEWTDALKLPVSGYVTVKRLNDNKKVNIESHFDMSTNQSEKLDNKVPKKKKNGTKFNKNKKIKT